MGGFLIFAEETSQFPERIYSDEKTVFSLRRAVPRYGEQGKTVRAKL